MKLDKEIELKIKEKLTSPELIDALMTPQRNVKDTLVSAAEAVSNEIRKAAFITVDARKFSGKPDAIYEYPLAGFATLNQLTDEVYFQLGGRVPPFAYG